MEDSNMKKTYIKPSMSIVQLQHQCQILSASEPAGRGLKNKTQDLDWDEDELDEDDELR